MNIKNRSDTMYKLKIIQAEYGDCFILEYGTEADPKYILIDGGPHKIYEKHLRNELEKINQNNGKLDLVVLSHVDKDHIIGLLDFFAELRALKASNQNPLISVDNLWFNSFNETIGKNNDISSRVEALGTNSSAKGYSLLSVNNVITSYPQGDELRRNALLIPVPINSNISSEPICVDNVTAPIFFDNLELTIVGPTKSNLDKLLKDWKDWLNKQEAEIAKIDFYSAGMTDKSIPNISSIMFLAKAENKQILFTGDGRGDHLIEGLHQLNLLDGDGKIHVDILKVPHHGSFRNVSKDFFNQVTADTYIISGNGYHGNPDLSTLIWIVESAKERGEKIEIILTNETLSTTKLILEYDKVIYGYKFIFLDQDKDSMTLTLA